MTDTMPAADSIMLKEDKPVKKMVEPKDRIVRKPAYAKDLQKNKGDFKVITDLNK